VDPPWAERQSGDGALTHSFDIGGIESRRMVTPYHVYMLQRLAGVVAAATAGEAGRASVRDWLTGFPGGEQLLELEQRLQGCRVRKEGARLFSVD
jgi:hypothetical protein